MSDAASRDESMLSQEDARPHAEWRAALKEAGAARFDPVYFHHLEVLARRMEAASAQVRPVLADKFQHALADYRKRFQAAQKAAGDELAELVSARPELGREAQVFFAAGDYAGMRRLALSATPPGPQAALAGLNQHIQQRKLTGIEQRRGTSPFGEIESPSDMASVHRFRQAWSKIAAGDQVEDAVGRGPANAGPLNSHVLVLRSLALMRKLSPDYLQRFLSHVDTLLWLDQAVQKHTASKAKPVRRARLKK